MTNELDLPYLEHTSLLYAQYLQRELQDARLILSETDAPRKPKLQFLRDGSFVISWTGPSPAASGLVLSVPPNNGRKTSPHVATPEMAFGAFALLLRNEPSVFLTGWSVATGVHGRYEIERL